MVGTIIRDYIERGGKKLTVPGFGTFMRKDSGEIIFVDLLRTDDGVLAELVEDYGHYSEVEAMALIDRFIFEVRNDIEFHGNARIDDFGTMTRDEKGLLQFTYAPSVRPVSERAVQEKLFGEIPSREPVGGTSSRSSEIRQSVAGTSGVSQKPVGQRVAPTPRRANGSPQPKKKRADAIIIIAVIAAVIAGLVLYFGFSAGNMPFLNR